MRFGFHMVRALLAAVALTIAVGLSPGLAQTGRDVPPPAGGQPSGSNPTAQSVKEEDLGKLPGDPVTKLDANLSAKDVQEIYEQALAALRGFHFPEKYNEIQDGTSLTLQLSAYGRGLMAFYHIGQTSEEIPEVARVLALINKHLPKEHQVY